MWVAPPRTGARGAALITLLSWAFVGLAPVRAQVEDQEPAEEPAAEGPDEIILIEDDGGDGFGDDGFGDEDEIIIVEEGDEGPPAEAPPISGALGRLWESWHVSGDSRARLALQSVEPADGPLRTLAGLTLETSLLPAPNLSLFANGFARVAVDASLEGADTHAFADLYEAYASINAEVGSVQLGRLVIPWGRTQVAALGDRLNPPDLRRGIVFPEVAVGRQPQWGGWLRTSLGAFSLDALLFVLFEPTEGSLAASDQGGFRLGEYQGALVRSPARVGGLLRFDDRRPLIEEGAFSDRASFALRVRRRVGDLDVGGSFVYGVDETPSLRLNAPAARYLARDLLAELGVDEGQLEPPPCQQGAELACLGGRGALRHERTASFAADVSWGLGVVILRGELLAQPDVGILPGKTSLLVDPVFGLSSTKLSHYAAGLAAEGGLGTWVTGSLELFDRVWVGVPAGRVLHGVERAEPILEEIHNVHRLALGTSLWGAFLGERLAWRLRGEGGILQTDVLMSGQLSYRLPIMSLYVGAEANVFTGLPGTPGWLRQDATSFAIFLGEGA